MTNEEENITPEEQEFFKNVEVPFKRSKADVWNVLSENLPDSETEKKEVKVVQMSWYKISVAAVIIVLIGSTVFCKLYTSTFYANSGEHFSCLLPEGSQVELNAESSASYHPYWWFANREIAFEGEAFFKVEKGSEFSVVSNKGITQVLGTSFNISTRNENYRVYCSTGKVKVISKATDDEVIITPKMLVVLNKVNGKLNIEKGIESIKVLAWQQKKFNFMAEPLNRVLEELQRHYNITILLNVKNSINLSYTGYFDMPDSPDVALDLICTTFGFTFDKVDDKTYKISKNKTP